MDIKKGDFGAGQQEEISRSLGAFVLALIQAAPQIGPHVLSGGTLEIKTMSGAHLKFGFAPQSGGIILPGGIRPANNGGLIK
jgi:hypothetical protein